MYCNRFSWQLEGLTSAWLISSESQFVGLIGFDWFVGLCVLASVFLLSLICIRQHKTVFWSPGVAIATNNVDRVGGLDPDR